MKKKTIIAISVLVLVAAGAVVAYLLTRSKKEATTWITERPQKRDVQILVTATGTLDAVQSVEVGTQVSGVISKIWVDFNDVVRRNQPIAQLDMSNLRSTLDAANANLVRAQSICKQATAEYERNVFLLEKKVIPRADYEVALSNYQTARTSVTSAYAELKKAQTNLQYATIKAPIDGIIVSRDVDVGQTVAASFATPKLFVIANDLKKMQLQANVDEADIGEVKNGQQVFFKVDAFPEDTFYGIVKQIRLQPNVVQNVVNYSVMIDAPNPELKLLPGMNADVSIVVNEKKQVVTVPVAATRFRPADDTGSIKAPRVYLLENNEPKPINVHAGLSDGVFVEVAANDLPPMAMVITGSMNKETQGESQGLFQGPRQGTHSTMRNLQR